MLTKVSLVTVNKSDKLAIIILAAGQSSRLGQPKQLVVFQNKTLMQRQCDLALSVSNSVYCVLGFQAELLTQELVKQERNANHLCAESFENNKLVIVNNKKWQEGMSSSISAGIAELPADIDAAMIILVDQWQLNVTELKLMISKWRQNVDKNINNIIICGCHLSDSSNDDPNQRSKISKQKLKGPPTIFPKKYFKQLIELTGNNGAKSLFETHKGSLETFDYPEAFIDLDTPEQLQELMTKGDKAESNTEPLT